MTGTLEKNGNQTKQSELTNAVCFSPRVDILETDEELTLFADVPGVKPDGANIRYENGELILHARATPRHDGSSFILQEYGVGDFYRVFTIGETIDAERISAELKNGILTIHLPKTESVKPRRIAVKGG